MSTPANKSQHIPPNGRIFIFVDGNALFRAIDDMGEPSLKWGDLWALGGRLGGARANVVGVTFAFCSTSEGRNAKAAERTYLKALTMRRVNILAADGTREFHECCHCGHRWNEKTARSKDSDLAVEIFDAAYQNQFDQVFLVSDGWSSPTLERKFLERFPEKLLTFVCLRAPPRADAPTSGIRYKSLTKRDLRACLLNEKVSGDNGEQIVRPRDWAPGASAKWSDLEITGL